MEYSESRLSTKQEIVTQAAERPITQEEASSLTAAETLARGRIAKGGPAATAQSLADRQRNPGTAMDPKLPDAEQLESDFTSGRPITQAEASAVASAESHILGHGPAKNGPAATAQSVHDHQKRQGLV